MAASKSPIIRLRHIHDEIDAVTKAFEGVTFEAFVDNYALRRAAEHAILIISEAVKALSPSFTDRYGGVDWRAVRDIGNILRHEYFAVDTKILWRIMTDRLPELGLVIDQMMSDQSGS